MVTAREQYEGGYPCNGIDAREGNITVIRSTHRSYGYSLYNRRLGKWFMWFKYKRDALKKIEEIKTYGRYQ